MGENLREMKKETLKDKIGKGLDLAFERMLAEKQKNNGFLVFSQNGKIEKINANDFVSMQTKGK